MTREEFDAKYPEPEYEPLNAFRSLSFTINANHEHQRYVANEVCTLLERIRIPVANYYHSQYEGNFYDEGERLRKESFALHKENFLLKQEIELLKKSKQVAEGKE